MAKKQAQKADQPSAKLIAKRNFHHNKKIFSAGQELSKEEAEHCAESMEALQSEGLIEEIQAEPAQEEKGQE